MTPFTPLRRLAPEAGFKAGDVLVIFGEIFTRGYVHGLIDEAEKHGLKVICSTVGRRDDQDQLRPLNDSEIAEKGTRPLINIPLEAGFDMEPCSQDGTTPVSQLSGIKMSEWENTRLDWDKVNDSRKRGTERFRNNVTRYLKELDQYIPDGANVIFAHLMAGGVPRAKIIMPAMNRMVKGTGDRHLPSEKFWKSDLGKLCEMSFTDVTAGTLEHLIELSQALRARISKSGGTSRFVAYGYHGTEVLIKGEYVWQSYSPYIQGWAKIKLEQTAEKAWSQGVHAIVYNAAEILTNSSSIFVGVEVPLYPFMTALKREAGSDLGVQKALEKCASLLKPEHSISEVQTLCDTTLISPEIRAHCIFEQWPQHNSQKQMERLISTAEQLIAMHKDPKNLITFVLSEEIFKATGTIMFHDCWKPHAPVLWLGHDILAKALNKKTAH